MHALGSCSDEARPVTRFDYTVDDVYQELAGELQIPVIYDVDCGHVPPQMTFINGAFAEVETENGKGSIRQHFI